MAIQLNSCENKPAVFKDIYAIPQDIDSTDLIHNGFKSVSKHDFSVFPPKKAGTFYFRKATADYEVMITLKNNNTEGLRTHRIDLKKENFEKMTGKKLASYKRLIIHGEAFSVEENRHTDQIHLYRLVEE